MENCKFCYSLCLWWNGISGTSHKYCLSIQLFCFTNTKAILPNLCWTRYRMSVSKTYLAFMVDMTLQMFARL